MYIFCIPAGGTNPFITWTRKLNSDKKLVVLDIPGRGRKFKENPIDDINLLVESLINDIKSINDIDDDYVLFGYCYGAVLAYEMCRKLQDKGMKLPCRFISFGIGAPNSKNLLEENNDRTQSAEFKMMVLQFFNIDSLGSDEEASRAVEAYINSYVQGHKNVPVLDVEIEDVFPNISNDEKFEKQQLIGLLNNSMKQIEQDEIILCKYQIAETEKPVIRTSAIIIYGVDDSFVERKYIMNWKSFFSSSEFIETPDDHYSIMNHAEKFIDIINNI